MRADIQRRLGERVRTVRLRLGFTQEQLAERCGFTVKFISSIERGKVNVPLVTLCTVARALRTSASELLVGVDVPLPREYRSVEQLVAGRLPGQQAAIVRVLAAVGDLLAEAAGVTR
jgi:transcriptional regulator with XRE-family HTH domain